MWSESDVEQVKGLLMQFSGTEEVCAVMECAPGDLDALSEAAFGEPFAGAQARFAAIGRALLRKELMAQALGGNPKAMDMLAREQLGIGPVEVRSRTISAREVQVEVEEVTPLARIVETYRRLPAAED